MTLRDKAAERLVAGLVKALDVAEISYTLAAQMFVRYPGYIQKRLWLFIQAVIEEWSRDARYNQFDPEYKEVYEWAGRHDNDYKR